MIYERLIFSCINDCPCGFCGSREDVQEYRGEVVCQECKERMDGPIVIDGKKYTIENYQKNWVQIAGNGRTWQGTIEEPQTIVDKENA